MLRITSTAYANSSSLAAPAPHVELSSLSAGREVEDVSQKSEPRLASERKQLLNNEQFESDAPGEDGAGSGDPVLTGSERWTPEEIEQRADDKRLEVLIIVHQPHLFASALESLRNSVPVLDQTREFNPKFVVVVIAATVPKCSNEKCCAAEGTAPLLSTGPTWYGESPHLLSSWK